MAFCENCGAPLHENSQFCPQCGARVNVCQKCGAKLEPTSRFCPQCGAAVGKAPALKTAQQLEAEDIARNKGLSVLAYLGILVLAPLLAAKDSPYARYHANQGLVLWIASIIFSVVIAVLYLIALFPIIAFSHHGGAMGVLLILFLLLILAIGIYFLVATILGIVNAATGKKKPLPLIGKITILR